MDYDKFIKEHCSAMEKISRDMIILEAQQKADERREKEREKAQKKEQRRRKLMFWRR